MLLITSSAVQQAARSMSRSVMKVAASRTKLRAWPLETRSTPLDRVDDGELNLGIVPIVPRNDVFGLILFKLTIERAGYAFCVFSYRRQFMQIGQFLWC